MLSRAVAAAQISAFADGDVKQLTNEMFHLFQPEAIVGLFKLLYFIHLLKGFEAA